MSTARSPREQRRHPDAAALPAAPREGELRTLVSRLPAILYIADAGVDGRWHYISPGVEALLGFSQEEWMRDPELWSTCVHPFDRARVFDRENDLSEPGAPEEYRMRHRHGGTVWVRDEAALVSDEQGRARWHGVITDITDRKLAEIELERRAEQQAAVAVLGKRALQGAEVGALMREALDHATHIAGSSSGAVLQRSDDSDELAVRAAVGARAGLDAQSLAEELLAGVCAQIETPDSLWGMLWLANPADRTPSDGDRDFVQAIANILADAIHRRAIEDDIRFQAIHDPLTGLPNRVLFQDALELALANPQAQVAVVLLDLDNFKLVNDSLGHAAGDELLMLIAPRLSTVLRPGDTIARFGGDEFAVLLEQVPDERAASKVAARIVEAFEAPFGLSTAEHFAKTSVGISIARGASVSSGSLIRDADAALYEAKRKGRACFEVFDRAMRARTVDRLSIENDLRRAIERDELRVAYQPVVAIADGSISTVEALMRWEHPRRGTMAPDEFIPVAEESGIIESLGRWVLERACAGAGAWQSRPESRSVGVSVNLSARQFRQRDLEAMIADALLTSGIEPSSLCLEITESALLEDHDAAAATLARLAGLGVRFVLDDFGTGYSSLAYLGALPIDGLKIDRSFVMTLGTDERTTAITTAIVRMAQALSIEVIAEGVEDASQLELLRGLGCDLAQGFHLHRPRSEQQLRELLRTRAAVPRPAHREIARGLGAVHAPPPTSRRSRRRAQL